jgi:hypothetical protein
MSSPRPSSIPTPPGSAPPSDTSAKAKEVANETAEQAKRVAGEAQDQAKRVAGDIADHARDVMDQTRSEVRSQADQGAQRVAGGLRTLGQQLQALREGRTSEAGPLKDYADQARQKVDSLAARLDARGIDGVASDLTAFARRRPGLFLLGCAGAGFAVARLVRSSQAATTTQGSTRPDVGDGSRLRTAPMEAEMARTGVLPAPSAP